MLFHPKQTNLLLSSLLFFLMGKWVSNDLLFLSLGFAIFFQIIWHIYNLPESCIIGLDWKMCPIRHSRFSSFTVISSSCLCRHRWTWQRKQPQDRLPRWRLIKIFLDTDHFQVKHMVSVIYFYVYTKIKNLLIYLQLFFWICETLNPSSEQYKTFKVEII